MSTRSQGPDNRRTPWRIARFSRSSFVDLVVVCFLGNVDEFQMYDFMVEFDFNMDWRNRTSPVALLIDTTSLTSFPDNASEVMRTYMADHRAQFKSLSACTSIVVESALLRMFLRGVFAIQKPASHVEVSSNFVQAIEHLVHVYNVVMPTGLELEALGMQLDHREEDHNAEDDIYDDGNT